MALLTADDVLNKKFQPTKFREGYDQDEVDDFLDEVVNTLRAVYNENEGLKAKLAAGGNAPQAAAYAAPFEEPVVQEPEAEPVAEETPAAGVEEAPAEQTPAASFVAAGAVVGGSEPESATGMLHLAQRLHDEYVRNGKDEADRLISSAREESELLTSSAKNESERVTREAEELRTNTLNQLENERNVLERKIDELRGFERDYRARLKSYLEGLLADVDGRAGTADPLASPGSGELRRY